MIIVSNTGPIIGLAKINLLDILKNFSAEVLIPPAVHRELLGKVGVESSRIDRALSDFIHVTEVAPLKPPVRRVLADLDEGERQAISLASSLSDKILLLLDDRAGRAAARELKIPTTGLIGILLLAKEKRLINKVGPQIDELRRQGYWVSDEVVQTAKELAGEK